MQLEKGKEEVLCLLFYRYRKTPCRHCISRVHLLQQNLLQFM
jgi:hypothetical protein